MALSLLQKGTGDALCVYAGPLPDASPGHPDTTSAPSIPGPTRAALGPGPCIIGVNARGIEGPEEILAFAERATGRKLWWAVLVGASRGCSKVRDLWAHGASALALVLGDGMHGSKPPDAAQLGFAQSIAALGRTGAMLVVVVHTYIDPGAAITSTAEMARRATGWALPPPGAGTTVVRVEEPAGGASADPKDWRGELVVISRASTPNDRVAHQDVLGRLLPLAIQAYVRPLVDLSERPEVSASAPPEASPEPAPRPFPSGASSSPAQPLPTTPAPSASAAPRTSATAFGRAPSPDGPRYLLIGDSYAEGFGPPLARLALAHGLAFQGFGVRSTTIGHWLSGANLRSAIDAADPTVTIVSLGANDAAGGAPAGRRAAELIDALRRNGSAAVLWIAPPTLPKDSEPFREALAEACAARDVRLFDTRAEVPNLERPPGDIHPTAKGYQVWADAIARWVPFADPAAAPAGPRAPADAAGDRPPPAPALVTLLGQLDARWPGRSKAADGIAPSAAHHRQNPRSDHEHLDALDVTHDPVRGPDLDALATALLDDDRAKYVIWRRRIANPQIENGAWRPYTGSDPHTNHLHLSIDPAKRDHGEPWRLDAVGTADGGPGVPREPVPGRPLPPARPFTPGEGRSPPDPSEPLGARAVAIALDEERARAGRDRADRMYRRGTSPPGGPWDAAAFSYAGMAALKPGETLPHPYTSAVPILVGSAAFRGQGYTPRHGDGAVFVYRGDPRSGGQGRIGRVAVPPDAGGAFQTIEGDGDGGGWQQRLHRLDEPELIGFVAYPEEARVMAPGLPKEIVVEDMGPLPLEEYVARVVTAENGRSREPQSLQALALAARTYAVYLMRAEGWGTAARPMPNSTTKQVVAGTPAPLATAAAQATRGGLVLWKHQPILAFHNAGAIWPKGALTGAGGRDESGTEKNITYNRGRRAKQVKPSPIAKPIPANRGCLSQNGADELGRQGYGWPEILRWFYGDIEFTIPEPPSRRSPPVRLQPSSGPSPEPSPEEGDSSVLPLLAGAAGAAVLAKLFLG